MKSYFIICSCNTGRNVYELEQRRVPSASAIKKLIDAKNQEFESDKFEPYRRVFQITPVIYAGTVYDKKTKEEILTVYAHKADFLF